MFCQRAQCAYLHAHNSLGALSTHLMVAPLNLDVNRGFHAYSTFAVSGSINLSSARAWPRHVLFQTQTNPVHIKCRHDLGTGKLVQ